MNKRRRTSSDIETDDSDDSEQFATVPAVRKRKKLDPVSFVIRIGAAGHSFWFILDGTLSATLWHNPES